MSVLCVLVHFIFDSVWCVLSTVTLNIRRNPIFTTCPHGGGHFHTVLYKMGHVGVLDREGRKGEKQSWEENNGFV